MACSKLAGIHCLVLTLVVLTGGGCFRTSLDDAPSASAAKGPGNLSTDWTRQLENSPMGYASGIGTDRYGNIYVVGFTDGAAGDVFLAKFDGKGDKQWTQLMGQVRSDNAGGLTVAADDSVFLVYSRRYTAGSDTAPPVTGTFVARYNGDGIQQSLWEIAGFFGSVAITTDLAGNVYLAGPALGSMDGNPNAGASDMAVMKLDPTGERQWARQIGTSLEDFFSTIAVDAVGNVYVAGSTQGELDGNQNVGAEDLVLVKFDRNGSKKWLRQTGTIGSDFASAMALDASGAIYLTGSVRGSLDGNSYFGGYDLYVAKYDPSGAKRWIQQVGTAGDEYGLGIAVSAAGTVYVAGSSYAGVDGNTNLGGMQVLALMYDSDGTKLAAMQKSLPKDDDIVGMALDGEDNIILAGNSLGNLDGNPSADRTFVMKWHPTDSAAF